MVVCGWVTAIRNLESLFLGLGAGDGHRSEIQGSRRHWSGTRGGAPGKGSFRGPYRFMELNKEFFPLRAVAGRQVLAFKLCPMTKQGTRWEYVGRGCLDELTRLEKPRE